MTDFFVDEYRRYVQIPEPASKIPEEYRWLVQVKTFKYEPDEAPLPDGDWLVPKKPYIMRIVTKP